MLISVANASDQYTDRLYTSITFLYWCTYKKMPTGEQDISKVTNVHNHDSFITTDYDTWLEMISYEIKGDELTIIKRSKEVQGRKFQSAYTSTSSTSCKPADKD